jgi:hypothetical protein
VRDEKVERYRVVYANERGHELVRCPGCVHRALHAELACAQIYISHSSVISVAEAENAALFRTSRKAVYLGRIAAELVCLVRITTALYEDNSPVIDAVKKDTNDSDRTKCIEIAFHYMQI